MLLLKESHYIITRSVFLAIFRVSLTLTGNFTTMFYEKDT